MSKKILITGGSGFVGGFLVEEAVKRGLTTHVAVRKSSDTSFIDPLNVHLVYPDILNSEDLINLLREERYDYIIHNAGVTQALKEADYFNINYGSVEAFTKAINQLAKRPGFTFVSSLAAYGPAEFHPEQIIRHTSEPHPVTHYGRSKLAAEKYLNSEAIFPYKIVRPTAVYGPREKDLLQVFKIVNKGINVSIGKGAQQLTFIYVKDLARAILDISLSDIADKNFNISDGNIYDGKDFGQYVADSLGKRKVITLAIPETLVRVLGRVNDTISLLTGKTTTINSDKVNELAAKSWVADIENLNKIGFKPKYDLAAGIEETVAWYRTHKWL